MVMTIKKANYSISEHNPAIFFTKKHQIIAFEPEQLLRVTLLSQGSFWPQDVLINIHLRVT
jgi:hypothetical protein